MALSTSQLQQIREEVGGQPDDVTLNGLFDTLGDLIKVELAVLRPRLADALAAAATGSITIPGAISIGAPANPTMLLEQIQRLEVELAEETGDPEPGMLAGVTVMCRRSTLRGAPFING